MRQTAELREHIVKMASGMGPNGLSKLLGDVRGILQERGIEMGCGRAQDPRPSRMFSVPEGVRYLDGMQLEALTRAVDQWAAQARNQPTRLSRQRIRMIYLMLRYSGAKVGEVLCMDDMRDLDFNASEVMICGEKRLVSPHAGSFFPVASWMSCARFLSVLKSRPYAAKSFEWTRASCDANWLNRLAACPSPVTC